VDARDYTVREGAPVVREADRVVTGTANRPHRSCGPGGIGSHVGGSSIEASSMSEEEVHVRERELGLACHNVASATSKGGELEGSFNFPFGGDPEEIMRGLQEFAEKQTEALAEQQREQFATLTLNTAVELTSAALSQLQVSGAIGEQATSMRDAMRVLFPEAVALVSAARQGFMRGR
jgi:hypothetical protein